MRYSENAFIRAVPDDILAVYFEAPRLEVNFETRPVFYGTDCFLIDIVHSSYELAMSVLLKAGMLNFRLSLIRNFLSHSQMMWVSVTRLILRVTSSWEVSGFPSLVPLSISPEI